MAKRHTSGPPPIVAVPEGPGPHPGVVIGAEAYGINSYILGVQQKLVRLGYAVSIPDYYHGNGPTRPEAYDDHTEVVEHLSRLDFTCGARDLTEAIDDLRALPNVDPKRIALWGYCTGGTLAWLAAAMRGDVAAAVLFYPSQTRFRQELGPLAPVHPIDLLWQLTCPTLFLFGDQDFAMPPAWMDELRAKIDQWDVDAEIKLYPGAGHAFSAPSGPLSNPPVARVAWDDAVAFLRAHTAG
jgi:carboxymethylenebutenolidase